MRAGRRRLRGGLKRLLSATLMSGETLEEQRAGRRDTPHRGQAIRRGGRYKNRAYAQELFMREEVGSISMIEDLTKKTPSTERRGDGPAPAGDPDEATIDGCFDALASRRRRQVLAYLEGEGSDEVSFDALVSAVVAAEPRPDARTGHYEQVALALHHAHLPKLERAGLVEYDPRARTVRYRGHSLISGCLAIVDELREN